MRYIKHHLVLFIALPFVLLSCQHTSQSEHASPSHLASDIPFDSSLTIDLDSTSLGIQTILSGLDVPWEITWGPDNWIWFTEENGIVSKVNPATGERKTLLKIPDIYVKKLGMLSMAIHPDFLSSPYVFLNYTFLKDSVIASRLIRYSYNGEKLTDPLTLMEIPANTGHNGSRLVIGPDRKLFWATGDVACCGNGDATSERVAQQPHLLNGKILRLNMDGSIPADNPSPESAVWALGFRVPQGLVYASNGLLYSAEHGDATDDEINLIRRETNYGYPDVNGFCDRPEELSFCSSHVVADPLKSWTPTIAPAGLDYYNASAIPEWKNSILLVTLKTQTLRVLSLNQAGDVILSEKIYLKNMFGRLRDICVSPAGEVYISTSNQDWNPAEGFPKKGDDRIIRLFKAHRGKKSGSSDLTTKSSTVRQEPAGTTTYSNYCASCHKHDGAGVTGLFPPLKQNPTVAGNKNKLISVLLKGMSGSVKGNSATYERSMPAFDFLTDRELAEVLTYIRYSFNNSADEVTVEDIRKIRNKPERHRAE